MDPTDNPFFSTINGMFSSSSSSTATADVLFGRASAAPAPVPTEPVRRKRGRPRKYGLSPSKPPAGPPLVKRESASFRKIAQLEALGNAGQGFTPHVITVPAGEDVAQKIMSFAQLREKAVCILSCSGSISNASLSQPSMLGGNITYEGTFEILSLSGSFLHTGTAGESSRTGGMSVCLSGTDGHIVGGGVGGPLIAAGLVQVIVGSFSFDMNNDLLPSKTIDASTNLQSPVPAGSPILSPTTFRSVESSGRITSSRGSDDSQSLGGGGSNNHILQSRDSRPLNMMSSRMPPDWRIGRYYNSVHNGETCLSPEKANEFHIQD